MVKTNKSKLPQARYGLTTSQRLKLRNLLRILREIEKEDNSIWKIILDIKEHFLIKE